MKLPEDERYQVKEPKGKLFEDLERAIEYLDSLDYKELITVGDVASSKLLKRGLNPDMIIVDFKIMRSPAGNDIKKIVEEHPVPQIRTENPPGHISEDLWNGIKTAETPIKIIVEGEEDLATIPAVLHAPNDSVVAYGQPGEGIVLVEVSEEKKEEFMKLFELFKKE